MEYDLYDLYERQVREELSMGEYDDNIIQWYLHGELVVKSYISSIQLHSATELIPAL